MSCIYAEVNTNLGSLAKVDYLQSNSILCYILYCTQVYFQEAGCIETYTLNISNNLVKLL